MDEKLLGKCGFYCGACSTYLAGNCKGCMQEYTKGDCFSRDCVMEKGLDFCGQCSSFPCDDIIGKPHATVLDPQWLLWEKARIIGKGRQRGTLAPPHGGPWSANSKKARLSQPRLLHILYCLKERAI